MNVQEYEARFKAYEGVELYHAFEMTESGVIFLSFRPQEIPSRDDSVAWLGSLLSRESPGNLPWYNSYEVQLSVKEGGLFSKFIGPIEVYGLVCTHEEAEGADDLLSLVRDRLKTAIDLDAVREDPAVEAAAETLLKAFRLVDLKSKIAGQEYGLKIPRPDEPSFKRLMLEWMEDET